MAQSNYKGPLDYIDVATRIVEFRTKYPDGSLQPADLTKPYTLETINGNQCLVVVAAAYRSPDDSRPGIGMAYEPVPGATNFTRGSELQNAETAAWGRAIVAALAADTKKGIASSEEVRNRQADVEQPQQQQGIDWQGAFNAAKGDKQKLEALRNQAKQSGMPENAPLAEAIAKEIAALTESEPVEGQLV